MQLARIASCEFRFSETIRAETWRVFYRDATETLSLVLTLAADGAEWHVYVQPPNERTELRKWLELPQLRMRCSGSTLLEGEWQVRLPVEQHTNVTIIDIGEPVDSFEAGFGFDPKLFEKKDKPNGDDQSQQRSSAKPAREPLPSRRRPQLQIKLDRNASASTDTDVSGTYELLPKCFGALGSLHKRTATDGTAERRPLYFFLDPKSVGPAEKDCFVFAHDWRRLAYAQTRTSTVLTLDHTFRAKAEKDAKAEEDVEKGKDVECKVHAKPLYCATNGTARTGAKRSAGECRLSREGGREAAVLTGGRDRRWAMGRAAVSAHGGRLHVIQSVGRHAAEADSVPHRQRWLFASTAGSRSQGKGHAMPAAVSDLGLPPAAKLA